MVLHLSMIPSTGLVQWECGSSVWLTTSCIDVSTRSEVRGDDSLLSQDSVAASGPRKTCRKPGASLVRRGGWVIRDTRIEYMVDSSFMQPLRIFTPW